MTMKEMEEFTGMTRANIRFYEAEGLICPERKENGYRSYSREDGQQLLKIKLLRCLDISIEEVKALQQGAQSLETALENSLKIQEEKQYRIRRAAEISRRLLEEKVQYDTMDAALWLHLLESEEDILKQDRVPTLNLPWRRFFARDFDAVLCSMIVGWILPSGVAQSVRLIMSLLTMVLLEPLCLHLFATTPGKAIFGIRVTDLDGGRLSYYAGLQRTCTVLWEGECLRIPGVSLYFNYRSYQLVEEGELLSWEENSELTFRDGKDWRLFLYAFLWLATLGLDILVLLWKEGIFG